MIESLTIRGDIVIPATEIWFTASRSGGPGGQHANKTSSRVTLHWRLARTVALNASQRARVMARLSHLLNRDGELTIHVEDERSQHRNKSIALNRLSALVLKALEVPKRRVPTRISKRVHQRRLAAKRQRAQIKNLRNKPTPEDH